MAEEVRPLLQRKSFVMEHFRRFEYFTWMISFESHYTP